MRALLALALVRAAPAQEGDPYARLASAVERTGWAEVEAYLGGKGPRPAFVPADASPLAAARLASDRGAAILEGLRRATDEPYAPTSQAVDVGPLSRLVAAAAHVRFADGERRAGVTLLLDGLTMARRLRSEPCEKVIFDAFVRDLDAIPLPECERVRAFVAPILAASKAPETRLRLLRLHMRVEAYRWRNLKLPDTLAQAAPPAETVDGASRAFRYERGEAGHRLESP